MGIKKLLQLILTNKTICLIFLLGLFLRLFQLTTIPHGFHVDEVISGYIGRFILLHGKDVYGNTFPLFYFDSFGDFRTILPMYINGVSTFIFGVTIFAVRFPTALIGALTIFPIFLISKLLLKNEKLSLIPPLVFAILPWSIVLSRATEEAVVGLTLVAFALYFLLQSIFEKKITYLLIGSLFLFTTYFIYPSFRVLSPFVLLPLPFFTKIHKRWYLLCTLFFILLTAAISLTPYGLGRFKQTSLFGSTELANRIKADNTALQYDEGNNGYSASIARAFHNKATGYFQELENQYFSYFSPNFLFLHGGLPERYVVPLTGLLYVSFGLLLFALLLPVSLNLNNKIVAYLLYLLLISPIPAILTIEDVPNINRAILMSLILVFLIGIGFAKAYNLFKSRKYKIAFSLFIILATLCECIYFQHEYFAISPSYKSFYRNDGNVELIMNLQKYPTKDIVLPIHDMPMYYLFFNNDFDKSLVGAFQKNLSIKKINNVNFVTNLCPTNVLTPSQRAEKNLLVVQDGNCAPNGDFALMSTITRRDSTVAFRILSPK